jgi:gas vesicle protein
MAKLVNFLLGFITGALVSSVAVTLFAPSSGIELQDQLKEYVRNMQDEVQSAREMRRREMEEELAKLRKS